MSDAIDRLTKVVSKMQQDIAVLRQEMADQLSVQTGGRGYANLVRPFPAQMIHQFATIGSGQSGYVWQFDAIRADMPAMIQYLGVKWFQNSTVSFRVDGTEVELITRTIGDINNPIGLPITLKRSYIATNSIDFYVQNNDTTAHVFEVYCNGAIRPNTDLTQDANYPGGADSPYKNPLGI